MVFALELSPAAVPVRVRLAVAVPPLPDSVAVPRVSAAVENVTVPVGVVPLPLVTTAEMVVLPVVAMIFGLAATAIAGVLFGTLPECQAMTSE
jgi:hypothetical protein